MHDHERHSPIRVYTSRPDERNCMKDGGLATAASKVAKSGREGDSMVIHVNKQEFEQLCQDWGDPTINPETGMPEFFSFGKLLKSVAGPAAGAIAGAFLPGIGETVGGWFPSLAESLGPTGLQALLSGGIGAGVGALTNGGEGALLGGLGGLAGAYGADYFNGGTMNGAVDGVSASSPGAYSSLAFGPNVAKGAATAAVGAGNAATNKNIVGLLGGLNMLGGAFTNDKAAKKAAKAEKRSRAQFESKMPEWDNPRTTVDWSNGGVPDYTQEGERSYFANNGFGKGGLVTEVAPAETRTFIPMIGEPDYTTQGEHMFFNFGSAPGSTGEITDTTRDTTGGTSGTLPQVTPNTLRSGMGSVVPVVTPPVTRTGGTLPVVDPVTQFPLITPYTQQREQYRSSHADGGLVSAYESGGKVSAANAYFAKLRKDQQDRENTRNLEATRVAEEARRYGGLSAYDADGNPTDLMGIPEEGNVKLILQLLQAQMGANGGTIPDPYTGYSGGDDVYPPVEKSDREYAYGGMVSAEEQGEGGMDSASEEQGEDGRSDGINAVLSDGEYVIDAETVALLGNGSTKAGAEKLDQFREQIRQHKGEALAQGKISPDAMQPLDYLGAA